MILAAIDIGSNAARLLITEISEEKKAAPQFTKLNLLRIPLRLGMDVFRTGEISAVKETMIADCMSIFSDLMKLYKVENYRACATSAMRDAKNGAEIIKKIKKKTGIKIEIITGDEEADVVFANHTAESLNHRYDYLYIDVGGGSTELTFYRNKTITYRQSINIGTIRILQDLVDDKQWKNLQLEISKNIKSEKPIIAIGAGGNINKIFSLSRTKDGKPLTLSTLQQFYKDMNGLSVQELMSKYRLREDRADVLVPALRIYNTVMETAKIEKILVPKISVADGLIHDLYDKLTKTVDK